MEDFKLGYKSTLLIAFATIFFAVFFRFWHIQQTPPGMWMDEAVNAIDGIRIIENQEIKIFLPEYGGGRESLYIYFVGFSTKLFGENQPWATRLPSAVFGALGIIGLYFFAKELFGRNIALLSAYFLAVSFWHTVFSRIAFRGILMPVIICFLLYFLIKGIRQERLIHYILSGVLFGVGFYTYVPYRIMPLVLFICLPLFVMAKRQSGFKMTATYQGVFVFLVAALIVSLPIGLYFIQNFAYFGERISGLSVFNMDTPWLRLLWNVLKTFLMFASKGDMNPRHNIPGRPQLSLPEAIFFLVGLMVLFIHLLQGFRTKDWWKTATSSVVLSLWALMLVPAIVPFEGVPHALRSLGSIAPTYIMIGLGLSFILNAMFGKMKSFSFGPVVTKVSLAALLVGTALINFQDYFDVYASHPDVEAGFLVQYVELGEFLNQLPKSVEKYVFLNSDAILDMTGLPASLNTIRFITSQDPSVHYVQVDDLSSKLIDPHGNYVILPLVEDPNLVYSLSFILQVDLELSVTDAGVFVIWHGEIE
jgi:4-amino-4-deoxy-L-arabinose transferase-like glycosyltransferase